MNTTTTATAPTGRLFGYARVSTSQQSLVIQMKALTEQNIEAHRIFTDKASGKNLDRSGLDALRGKVEKGDTVLVAKMDRLGRNTLDMLTILREFRDQDVAVRFFQDGISTESEMGTMVITILAAVAQSERARILERTNEGRIEAKAAGVKFGAKQKYCRTTFKDLYLADTRPKDIIKTMGLSRAAYYLLKKELLSANNIKEVS